MKVSFEGIGESVVTFYNKETGGAEKGKPVKLSGNGEVANCAAGDRFAGICIACDVGHAAVQTTGYVQMKYSDATAPAVGFKMLAADGIGGVKVAASGGGEFLVVDVDTTDKIVGFML